MSIWTTPSANSCERRCARSPNARSCRTSTSGSAAASCRATCTARRARPGCWVRACPNRSAAAAATAPTRSSSARRCTRPARPGGVFASLFTCGIAVPHMIASGDQRLIDTYVRPTLAGDKIGSLAITEPGGGSDVGHLTHHRGPRRRRLRRQRRQDLHHLRRAGRLRRDRGAHRRPRRRGGFAAGGRQGHARIRGQPQAGQDGLALLGHRRAVLRRRRGCRRPIWSARRTPASRRSRRRSSPSGSALPRRPIRARSAAWT